MIDDDPSGCLKVSFPSFYHDKVPHYEDIGPNQLIFFCQCFLVVVEPPQGSPLLAGSFTA
jgi:hypothetical protein